MTKLNEKALEAALRAFSKDVSGPIHEVVIRAYLDALPPIEGPVVEAMCEAGHNAYEIAAAGAGWETNTKSRKPWAGVPEENKIATRASMSAALSLVLRIVEEEQGKSPNGATRQAFDRLLSRLREGTVPKTFDEMTLDEALNTEPDPEYTAAKRMADQQRAYRKWSGEDEGPVPEGRGEWRPNAQEPLFLIIAGGDGHDNKLVRGYEPAARAAFKFLVHGEPEDDDNNEGDVAIYNAIKDPDSEEWSDAGAQGIVFTFEDGFLQVTRINADLPTPPDSEDK